MDGLLLQPSRLVLPLKNNQPYRSMGELIC